MSNSAPFTEQQVDHINAWQRNDYTQELVCEDCDEVLVAEPSGIVCPCCEAVTRKCPDGILDSPLPQRLEDLRFEPSLA